ncbi:MAG: MBL fold metallo-hydrolase [Cyanobacteria bacterium RI_101]|nr:MBL fold metallo-hydrolase [Cyanobacteria bacterium RI_101]
MLPAKPPRLILPGLYRFPPNRDTLGGTAYFCLHPQGNLLIDAPPQTPETESLLLDQGGVRYLVLTQRDGAGPALGAWQKRFNFEIVVQEQEAYLLPQLRRVTFADQLTLAPELTLLWTPGYSPGALCLYDRRQGGVLFTGRHLTPDAQGQPQPLRSAKTFHWRRQLKSVAKLQAYFAQESLAYLCPGAYTGFLRGRDYISPALPALRAIATAGNF